MPFTIIPRHDWPRNEIFTYYLTQVPCQYSMTVSMDITGLMLRKRKLYPSMLYALATVINRHEEFRMAFNEHGELGFWDEVWPCYTLFHPENETFTDIWSEYSEDFSVFYAMVTEDMERYRHVTGHLKAKDGQPPHICPVSSVPWLAFTHFAQDSYAESNFLSPLIKFGKYEARGEKIVIPVSVSVHHAVADGFHTCRLINDMQEMASFPARYLS